MAGISRVAIRLVVVSPRLLCLSGLGRKIARCREANWVKGVLAEFCAVEDNLGGICSCVPDVQSVIEVQTAKGKEDWPVKCPY
jgi:hypothetical protein